jgi:hypothetical protein
VWGGGAGGIIPYCSGQSLLPMFVGSPLLPTALLPHPPRYLKQEIAFGAPPSLPGPVISVSFDPESALRMFVATRTSVLVAEFALDTDAPLDDGAASQVTVGLALCSLRARADALRVTCRRAGVDYVAMMPCASCCPSRPPSVDRRLLTRTRTQVAVTDTARVLLTPFRKMIVPPPMSACAVVVPAVPRAIAHAPGSRESLAVLMSDGGVAILEGSEEVRGNQHLLLKVNELSLLLVSLLWLAAAARWLESVDRLTQSSHRHIRAGQGRHNAVCDRGAER